MESCVGIKTRVNTQAYCLLAIKMAHWKDEKVKELLAICGEEEITKQITGTVKDATVYNNIAVHSSRW